MAQLKEGSVIKKPTGDEVIATVKDIQNTNDLMPKSGGVLENYSEELITLTGYAPTISLIEGSVFKHTVTQATTYSITDAVNNVAHSFTLIITQASMPQTIIFPTSVKWQGGEVPDMSTGDKTYILTFLTVNGGTNWFGMFGGEF